MPTLKLKKSPSHGAPKKPGGKSARPPVRGRGAKPRPTLAQARAERERDRERGPQHEPSRGASRGPTRDRDAGDARSTRSRPGDPRGRDAPRDPRERDAPRGPRGRDGSDPPRGRDATRDPRARELRRPDDPRDARWRDEPRGPRGGFDPRDPRERHTGPDPRRRDAGPGARPRDHGRDPRERDDRRGPWPADGPREARRREDAYDPRPRPGPRDDTRPRPPARHPQEPGPLRDRDRSGPRGGSGHDPARYDDRRRDPQRRELPPLERHRDRPPSSAARSAGYNAAPQRPAQPSRSRELPPPSRPGAHPRGGVRDLPGPDHSRRLETAPPPARPPRPTGAAPLPTPAGDGGDLRLSKRMSELGLASRREADEWIEAGWVRVDGQVVRQLGSRVRPEQEITIAPEARRQQAQRVTVLLHKPLGFVSGQAEDGHEPAAVLVTADRHWHADRSGLRFSPAHLHHLAPAGRLDIDSTGLLVLTQDGRVAKRLIGEDSPVEKEYLVRVDWADPAQAAAHEGQPLSEAFPAEQLERLRGGLELDGVALRPAKVSWQNESQLRFALREGRKRQIRRMCELVGLRVVALKRIRIGRIVLGDLPPGQWRYLGPFESF